MSIQESIDAQKLVIQIFNLIISIGGIVVVAGLGYSLVRVVFIPGSSTLIHQAKILGLWLLGLLVLIALWAAGTYILTPLCCAVAPSGALSLGLL